MTVRKQGRVLVLLLMAAIFLFMLGKSVSKWGEKKVGETQTTKSASQMVYPSVTMVPFFDPSYSISKLSSFNTSKNLTEYNLNASHIQTDVVSIEQSYELSNGTAHMELNESSYALKPDLFRVEKAPDITMWIAGVNDGLQELATYNPPGPTQPGMLNKLTIRLSTKNILEWHVYLHDPHHFTISQLMLYGKELINVQSSIVSGTWTEYRVEPIEVKHINQDNDPCISEEAAATNMWDCITDYMYSKLNCTLPWMAKGSDKNGHLCSSPEEYDLYLSEIIGGLAHNTEYVEKVAKCTPGCKRVEYSAKLHSTAPDAALADQWGLAIFFAKDKFPVKEQFYIYDTPNLIADFGGYLGLLLGYSLLGFYDTLMDLCEKLFEKCNRRQPGKEEYQAKSDPK